MPQLSETDKARFENFLAGKEPIEALRRFALDLSAQGLKQREIYLLFLSFYDLLQAAGRDTEEALLGDVMDMIVDTYPPFNLNIPK